MTRRINLFIRVHYTNKYLFKRIPIPTNSYSNEHLLLVQYEQMKPHPLFLFEWNFFRRRLQPLEISWISFVPPSTLVSISIVRVLYSHGVEECNQSYFAALVSPRAFSETFHRQLLWLYIYIEERENSARIRDVRVEFPLCSKPADVRDV